jgi:RNA methyltransferase, TrmH family
MISRNHAVSRRLRALKAEPAIRAAEGVLVAEGIHLAQEALASKAAIELGVVSPRLLESAEGRALAAALKQAGVVLHEASDATLDALQDARSPQPVVLVVKRTAWSLDGVIVGRGGLPLVVVACGVQDPGNLGALMRTAEAAGATGFVATSGSADLAHPRAVRATMGAIFRLPAAEGDLDAILDRAVGGGLRLVGAEARDATGYDAFDWTGRVALLLGSEGSGLPDQALRRLAARVSIPMAPGVESLSVGAAAAVLLFEAARARRLSRVG